MMYMLLLVLLAGCAGPGVTYCRQTRTAAGTAVPIVVWRCSPDPLDLFKHDKIIDPTGPRPSPG